MKKGIAIFAVLLAVIIVVPVAFILLVDPNMFGPAIKDKARQQGIVLHMGDVQWAFWPRLAIDVEGLSAATTEQPDKPLLMVEEASFSLDLLPVFKKQFHVNHIRVDSAQVHLAVDANGRGNWQSIVNGGNKEEIPPASPTPEPSQPEPSDGVLNLNIEKIQLTDSQFDYRNEQTQQAFAARNINLDINDVNLEGEPMRIQLAANNSLITQGQGMPSFNINAAVVFVLQLSKDFSAMSLDEGIVKATLQGEDTPAQDLELRYSMELDDLATEPKFAADFAANTINLRPLLDLFNVEYTPTADYALTQFGTAFKAKGTPDAFDVTIAQLNLDTTNLHGAISFQAQGPAVKVSLQGDKINIDHYLPVTAEVTPTPEPTAEDEALIPVDLLQTLQAQVNVVFQQITIAEAPISDITFEASISNGIAKVSTLQGTAFEGRINATAVVDARVDARESPPQLNFKAALNEIQLEPVYSWLDFTDKANMTGAVNFIIEGAAQGATLDSITRSLVANAQLTASTLRFYPLNIEEQVCKIADLIAGQKSQQASWNSFTELKSVVGTFRLANEIFAIEQLDAYIANLVLDASGKFDLNKGTYRVNLPVKLQETSTNASTVPADQQGCHLQSIDWLNKTMSLLVCKGRIASLDPVSDCRPDKDAVEKFVKEYAKTKLKEKHGDKIEAAEEKIEHKKEEVINKLEEKLKDSDKGKEIESKLKNLFGKPAKASPSPTPVLSPSPTAPSPVNS